MPMQKKAVGQQKLGEERTEKDAVRIDQHSERVLQLFRLGSGSQQISRRQYPPISTQKAAKPGRRRLLPPATACMVQTEEDRRSSAARQRFSDRVALSIAWLRFVAG